MSKREKEGRERKETERRKEKERSMKLNKERKHTSSGIRTGERVITQSKGRKINISPHL